MLIDGWFLSVARLHDPAKIGQNENLSVGFILNHSKLTSSVKAQLEQLASKMDVFASYMRPARNKLLAHNDRHSLLSLGSLGAFPQGEDQRYIDNLRQFTGVVSEQLCKEPFVYDDLSGNDVDALVSVLTRGLQCIDPEIHTSDTSDPLNHKRNARS